MQIERLPLRVGKLVQGPAQISCSICSFLVIFRQPNSFGQSFCVQYFGPLPPASSLRIDEAVSSDPIDPRRQGPAGIVGPESPGKSSRMLPECSPPDRRSSGQRTTCRRHEASGSSCAKFHRSPAYTILLRRSQPPGCTLFETSCRIDLWILSPGRKEAKIYNFLALSPAEH